MAGTWIVCPNLWGARVFNYSTEPAPPGAKTGVFFVGELPRPRVRTRLEDFPDEEESDIAGEPVEDPKLEVRVAEAFMEDVADILESAALEGIYESLILCAEPHLLRILKKNLRENSRARVIGTVSQDLYEVNETDLFPYIKEMVEKTSRRTA